MQKAFTLLLVLMIGNIVIAQTTADFENFSLDPESFLNGSDGSGGFSSGDIFLPNSYNEDFMSWSGWSVSNMTDVTTPGFMNQYSAITGTGVESTSNYGLAFINTFESDANIMQLNQNAIQQSFIGMYVTNGTYPYLSMLNGDGFAKKFGGVSGDDPDYFLLTIKGYKDGILTSDSIDFYLADYRFSDNNMDYIVDEWTYIDLQPLGETDSLRFTLSSTDVGEFGMNTPAYFCIDNVITGDLVNTREPISSELFEIFPNPASDYIVFKNEANQQLNCIIYDMLGKEVINTVIQSDGQQIDISHLPKGSYTIVARDGKSVESNILMKQ